MFVTFILLNVLNVILSTAKSIATVKCGKGVAALMNALSYGTYTIVVVFMTSELPLIAKVGTVAVTNLVGVYIVKWLEEKARKDRLWKIESTVPIDRRVNLHASLDARRISHNYINVGKWAIFNIYCETQEMSKTAKEILQDYDAKYFASETKIL